MPTIHHTEIDSPLGPLLLTMADGLLTGVIPAQQKPIADISTASIGDAGPFARVIDQLQEYFSGERREFDVPLRLVGTAFQRLVWEKLKNIPFGTTTTYGEIARRIGNPNAVRAVGLANGRNPIPIIVPCHRVIGADGRLTGYSGGLRNKSLLLDLESRASGDRATQMSFIALETTAVRPLIRATDS
jgi:methylated-DNA-[protein]-cysteine S-methyltransferase